MIGAKSDTETPAPVPMMGTGWVGGRTDGLEAGEQSPVDLSATNILVLVTANPGENPGRRIAHGFLGHVYQPRVRRS